jgi:hypothetical protein
MSGDEPIEDGGPIRPGSPLARALGDYAVPGLSADFADRVLAAAAVRSVPLPELRRRPAPGRGWRIGRRIAIGMVGFGALATAAAATGLLERLDIAVPSAGTVWESITGSAPAPAPKAPVVAAPPAAAPAALAPVEIVGPIDTPEELGEAFRRIDEVRQGRRAARRQIVEERIDAELERRRAAGLPVPSAEEEARLRQRIEEGQARRQQVLDERVKARREDLEHKVEAGEAVTREDVLRPLREDARALERRERLRRMSPEERRAVLQQLPPEERRRLVEEWRERRAQRAGAPATDAPASSSTQGDASGSNPAPLPQD